ncbi:MAG: protein-export chaperone SecB [Piscirickettsiaceae bacterium]|nr:MAG: protein-export chaperone SecB [Piscirickettsiaceae bacterium]
MADKEQPATKDAPSTPEKQFAIQKLYIKDISFESPEAPMVFTEKWEPHVDLNLSTKTNKAPQNLYETSITITVTVKNNDKTAYLVEATQVGIFGVSGFSDQEMGPLLGSFCPSVLFPYLREVISDLVTKAGFPQMLLNPVNFDALYSQQIQKVDKARIN